MSKAMIAALKTAEVEDGVIRLSNQFRDMIVSELETLELLREQEPVEPISIRQWDDDETTWWYSCGSCVQAVDYKDKYCRHCGKGLLWDA